MYLKFFLSICRAVRRGRSVYALLNPCLSVGNVAFLSYTNWLCDPRWEAVCKEALIQQNAGTTILLSARTQWKGGIENSTFAHESCLWKYSTLWSKYWAFKNVITKGLKIFIFFKCIKPVWEGGWMSYWKHLLCTFNWTMERTRQKCTLISQTEIKAQILRTAPDSSQKPLTVNLALMPPFILAFTACKWQWGDLREVFSLKKKIL